MASIWDELEAMRKRKEAEAPAFRAAPENPLQRWGRRGAVAVGDAIGGANTQASLDIEEGLKTVWGLLAGGLEPDGPSKAVTAFAKAGVPEAVARASKAERLADTFVKADRKLVEDTGFIQETEPFLDRETLSWANQVMGALSKTAKSTAQSILPGMSPSTMRDVALVAGQTDRRQFLGGLLSKMMKPIDVPAAAPKPPSELDEIVDSVLKRVPWLRKEDIKITPMKQWDVVDAETGEVLTEAFPRLYGPTKPSPAEFKNILKNDPIWGEQYPGSFSVKSRIMKENPKITIPDTPVNIHEVTIPTRFGETSVKAFKDEIPSAIQFKADAEIESAHRTLREKKLLDRALVRNLINQTRTAKSHKGLKSEVWNAAITEQVPMANRGAWRKARIREEFDRADKRWEQIEQEDLSKYLQWMNTGKFE